MLHTIKMWKSKQLNTFFAGNLSLAERSETGEAHGGANREAGPRKFQRAGGLRSLSILTVFEGCQSPQPE